MWIIILLWILVLIAIFVVFKRKKIGIKRISQKYSCEEGDFVIKGKKDRFIISKNKDIEFLVKKGQIVASRDLRVSKDFVYYGGINDGLNK